MGQQQQQLLYAPQGCEDIKDPTRCNMSIDDNGEHCSWFMQSMKCNTFREESPSGGWSPFGSNYYGQNFMFPQPNYGGWAYGNNNAGRNGWGSYNTGNSGVNGGTPGGDGEAETPDSEDQCPPCRCAPVLQNALNTKQSTGNNDKNTVSI